MMLAGNSTSLSHERSAQGCFRGTAGSFPATSHRLTEGPIHASRSHAHEGHGCGTSMATSTSINTRGSRPISLDTTIPIRLKRSAANITPCCTR
jgi:hypothetical protein